MKLARQFIKFLAAGMTFVGLSIAVWHLMYPSRSDPKNPRYVLWKVGLYGMDPELAIAPMVGDAQRDALVVGKSKEELRRKFGYLTACSGPALYLLSR
jgi:NhaP-type Na+/H+ and K+/H+ antiporter